MDLSLRFEIKTKAFEISEKTAVSGEASRL